MRIPHFSFTPAAFLTLLILCLAAGLRLWNFDFANPHIGRIEGGDDVLKNRQALEAANGTWQPTRFRQPAYLIHTSGVLLRTLGLTSRREGDAIWRATTLSMIGYSVLTVALTFALARRVTGDPATARIAALLMAVIPLDVIGSRYFKEDIPLMFFVTLTLYALASHLVTRRACWQFIAALALGTAIAVKYIAVLLIPVFLVTCVLHQIATPPDERKNSRAALRILASLLAIAAVFIAFNPHIITDWSRFRGGLDYQVGAVTTSHADGTVFTLADHFGLFGLRFALMPGLTITVLLATLTGIIWAIRTRNRAALLLLGFGSLWYIAMELNKAKPWPFFARYYHPLAPLLCLFAAAGIAQLKLRSRAALAVTAALVAALPLAKTFSINSTLKNETREQAVVWMLENLPQGSNVYLIGPHNPPIYKPPAHLRVEGGSALTLDEFRTRGVDHVVVSSFMYDRYLQMGRSSLTNALATRGKLEALFATPLAREFTPAHLWQTYGFHNPVVRIHRISAP